MKTIIIVALLLISVQGFSQDNVQMKRDTIVVPISKYNFIKVADKIYKINTTLEEIKPPVQPLADTLSYPLHWNIIPAPMYNLSGSPIITAKDTSGFSTKAIEWKDTEIKRASKRKYK